MVRSDLKFLEDNKGETFYFREWNTIKSSAPFMSFRGGNGFPVKRYTVSLDELAKHYHIIAFVNRAIYQKFKKEQRLTWSDYAKDLLKFVEQIDLDFDVAIGHFMGASTILTASSLKQDLFLQLILVELLRLIKFPKKGQLLFFEYGKYLALRIMGCLGI